MHIKTNINMQGTIASGKRTIQLKSRHLFHGNYPFPDGWSVIKLRIKRLITHQILGELRVECDILIPQNEKFTEENAVK